MAHGVYGIIILWHRPLDINNTLIPKTAELHCGHLAAGISAAKFSTLFSIKCLNLSKQLLCFQIF